MTSRESIIDTSIPNAGRIYDYLLGGHHNFEVDRQAAEGLVSLYAFLPKTMRLQRWCLQDLAVELAEKRGYRILVDFASGLPTNDHLHHVVPEGTTVIYSDYDPVVVEYAREILADTPDIYFFEADARRPEELLNRPEVEEILGGERDVALIYWGISAFLTDEEITHAAHYLYEWAGDKSCLAFNAQAVVTGVDDPAMTRVAEIYRQMSGTFELRSLEAYVQLTKPWRLEEGRFIPFTEWHGFDESLMTKEEAEVTGPGGGGYGAYLRR
jgi:hypothetical protein